jgi:hypothetical protein
MPSVTKFVNEALAQLGKPYLYGGNGPDSFDCSGLVQYCLTQIGVSGCPRTSEEQWAWCKSIPFSELSLGDLIFEQWPGDNEPPGHVCIFGGSGYVIESPSTGDKVWERPWLPTETTIVGYGRIIPLIPQPSPTSTVTAILHETNGDYRVVCPHCAVCFDVKP